MHSNDLLLVRFNLQWVRFYVLVQLVFTFEIAGLSSWLGLLGCAKNLGAFLVANKGMEW